MKKGDPPKAPARRRARPIRVKNIQEREKMVEALEMRKAGLTYDVIARRLGYDTHSGAARLVKRAMDLMIHELSLIHI